MKSIKALLLALIIPFSITIAGNDDNNKGKNNDMKASVAINGMVHDKITGEALTGVKVELTETSEFTYTDFEGNFHFGGLVPGQYKVKTSLISYHETTEAVELDTNKEVVEIKLETVN